MIRRSPWIVVVMLAACSPSPRRPSPSARGVLWSTFIGNTSDPIILVVAAYESKAECDAAERRFEQRAKERGAALTDKTGRGMSYDCFPDTVDPRGPKGKLYRTRFLWTPG
jgi:hypothetical protein